MNLLNLLQAITGNIADNPTDVDGITVTANRPKVNGGLMDVPGMENLQGVQPNVPGFVRDVPDMQFSQPDAAQSSQRVPYNYNNSSASDALTQAVLGLGTPQGGSPNPGIYGLLPERMQHGTLRNVLGALGDAFLVQSGNAPRYSDRMERQQIGQAMAGYDPEDPASVQAAIQRMMATGANGSIEEADNLQKNYTNAELKKAAQEQSAAYHQSVADSRKEAAIARYLPYIGGMVFGAKDQAAYANAYQRADAIAKRIDPDFSAADFGLIDPQDWTPELAKSMGLTANNALVSEDKEAQRATSRRNTDVTAGARLSAAEISGNKATNAVMLEGLIEKMNSGQKLTPAEQAFFDKQTNISGRKGRGLPPGLNPGGSASTQFKEGEVYRDANNNLARYKNGKWVKP